MLLKNINNLIITVDNRLELIYAIHALYKDTTKDENFDWIETPTINYFKDLKELIDIKKYPKLCEYIKYAFDNCNIPSNLMLAFDTNFNLDLNKIGSNIKFEYGNVIEFATLLKELAYDIKWNDFLESQKDFYINVLNEINITNTLEIKDIEKFYGEKKQSYTYSISVLINGGFGPKDNNDNIYAIRGFIWDEEEKKWENSFIYLYENLFHEFSHSYINPLVDKHFDKLSNIKLENISYNIPNVYSNGLKTILYEYFVRANAIILSSKYTNDLNVPDIYKNNGFPYLQELIDLTLASGSKYKTYEELFVKELIPFMYTLINPYKLEEETKSIKY